MAQQGNSTGGSGTRYTLRNPVPLRSAQDFRQTRAGLPRDETLALAGPVDHDSLAKAIRRSVGHEGMRPEDARAIAAHVLNFFGFNERIIDNVLEPDDRDTFYMLEDSGILETERDETTLYDGREWRIHYWMFRKDRIFDLAREETQAMREAGEPEIIYSSKFGRSGAYLSRERELVPPAEPMAVYHELGDEIWLERRRPQGPVVPPGTSSKARVRAPRPEA
jgi:hypothetical protein